ncbi:MAG: RNA-protein complex protein Nop10 [Thermoprotei archaeon]|nr:MAG: RNA-protein complex protein Nop10 [Thermoprotei archaeon]
MPKRIYRCLVCGRYTLRQDKCPRCGGSVGIAHPPRFSPIDKYGKYRREMKKWIEERLRKIELGEKSV